jgi:hypothetical protein
MFQLDQATFETNLPNINREPEKKLALLVTIDFDVSSREITTEVTTNTPDRIILKNCHTDWCKLGQMGNSRTNVRIWNVIFDTEWAQGVRNSHSSNFIGRRRRDSHR